MDESKTKPETKKKKVDPGAATREGVETVAVVLTLVCLLKGFVAEAFVIPTGSMATTLLGANRQFVCPECGYLQHVNAAEHAGGNLLTCGGFCQNCRQPLFGEVRNLNPLAGENGDRVVVAKYRYEGYADPQRWDVPVFKYPAEVELARSVPSRPSLTNFIKRLVGLGGEDVVILYGDVYTRPSGKGDFKIASKTPGVCMATRRLVFDNDLQPKDLQAKNFPTRWYAGEGDWKATDGGKVLSLKGDGQLLYRHLVGGSRARNINQWQEITDETGATPQLITDFEAYNACLTYIDPRPRGSAASPPPPPTRVEDLTLQDDKLHNWVGDLMLECTVEVAARNGQFTLELAEAARRYQCTFDLSAGKVTLAMNGKPLAGAEAASPITSTGKWNLRFANFDDRLIVWVGDTLVFGDGVEAPPVADAESGPTAEDLKPAGVAGKGVDVRVSHLKLFRDIYYTQRVRFPDASETRYPMQKDEEPLLVDWARSLRRKMEAVRETARSGEQTGEHRWYRVPEGSYLMCGDNSQHSSDGREWQTTHFVKRELILGRAVVVYWPIPMPPWDLKFAQ